MIEIISVFNTQSVRDKLMVFVPHERGSPRDHVRPDSRIKDRGADISRFAPLDTAKLDTTGIIKIIDKQVLDFIIISSSLILFIVRLHQDAHFHGQPGNGLLRLRYRRLVRSSIAISHLAPIVGERIAGLQRSLQCLLIIVKIIHIRFGAFPRSWPLMPFQDLRDGNRHAPRHRPFIVDSIIWT